MTLAERLLARIARPGTTVELTGARCLRRRFIRSGCDLCARACRPQAIYPGEGGVRLDAGRCQGCLVCTAACPTGALTGRDARLAQAPEKVLQASAPRRNQPGETVLGCEKSLRHGRELILPCLGGLSPEHLAAFALLTGAVTLLLHPCRECHSPWVPEVLQERVDELRHRWHGLADQPPIRLHREAGPPPSLPTPAPAGANDQGRGASPAEPGDSSDRRDFFRAFREISLHAAAETWTTLRQDEQRQEEEWAASKHLPQRLGLLRQAGERGDATDLALAAALLNNLQIGPDCTFCGACIGLCPSGAISGDDELAKLYFDPWRCSGCGLCREFCPARAIELSPAGPEARPARQEKRLLRQRFKE